MATNQGCKGIIPKPCLYYKFLFYYLYHNVELLNSLGTGATFKELSAGKLKEISIPVPPLNEQKDIVAQLDKIAVQIKAIEAICKQRSTHIEELKKSVLQKAFNGELAGIGHD